MGFLVPVTVPSSTDPNKELAGNFNAPLTVGTGADLTSTPTISTYTHRQWTTIRSSFESHFSNFERASFANFENRKMDGKNMGRKKTHNSPLRISSQKCSQTQRKFVEREGVQPKGIGSSGKFRSKRWWASPNVETLGATPRGSCHV